MKSSAVVLVLSITTACLFGLSTASPIAAEDVVNDVVPNRNMPQTIEPYVDFGKSGFLFKKRQNDDNVPNRNMPKTIEYVAFGKSGFLKKKRQNEDNDDVANRNMPKTIEYVDFGKSGFLFKKRGNNNDSPAVPVPSHKKQIKRRLTVTKTKKHKVTAYTTVIKKYHAKNGKKNRKTVFATVTKGDEKKLVTRQAETVTKIVTEDDSKSDDNNDDNNDSKKNDKNKNKENDSKIKDDDSNNSSGGDYPNSGKGTFFSPNRGSCGWKNTKEDLIVAVNEGDMNNETGKSDENPNCGRMVEIVNSSGDKVQAKVADTCPECSNGDLDLSPAAFIKLASYNQGIVKIKWKYLN